MTKNNVDWVAYYRVSTDKQGSSGLGLDAQRWAVRSFIAARGGELLSEHVEVESGRRATRPRLQEALRLSRVHGATLVIAKLDRLARNVAFVSNLMNSGVDFLAVDFPSANRLTIHILAAVAEHESELIRQRTKGALAAAKARGTRLGGDRGNLPGVALAGAQASAKARRERAARVAEDLNPLLTELAESGLSYRAIAAALNTRAIPTPRGGDWHGSQVYRIMALCR